MYFKCIYYSPKINCFLLEICKCKLKNSVPTNQTKLKKHTALHTANTKNGALPSRKWLPEQDSNLLAKRFLVLFTNTIKFILQF